MSYNGNNYPAHRNPLGRGSGNYFEKNYEGFRYPGGGERYPVEHQLLQQPSNYNSADYYEKQRSQHFNNYQHQQYYDDWSHWSPPSTLELVQSGQLGQKSHSMPNAMPPSNQGPQTSPVRGFEASSTSPKQTDHRVETTYGERAVVAPDVYDRTDQRTRTEQKHFSPKFTFKGDEVVSEKSYIRNIIDTYHSTEKCSEVLNQSSIPDFAKVDLLDSEEEGSTVELNVYSNNYTNGFICIWKFAVFLAQGADLKCVSLLCQEPGKRKAFKFIDRQGAVLAGVRVSIGECFKKRPGCYEVGIEFSCDQPGIYKQWVCFDVMGHPPFIVRQLHVFVGNEDDAMFEVERFRFESTVAQVDWQSASNVDVVISDWPAYDREEAARWLLARWKPLGLALENDSMALRTEDYGPDNYKRVMHGLIRLEEAAVNSVVSRLYIDVPTMRIEKSRGGYGLIGYITLGSALDPRTRVGALTLKSAKRMLLAFRDFTDYAQDDDDRLRRVYEADIIEKRREVSKQAGDESNSLFSTEICLHLSQKCVTDQRLQAGQSVVLHQARFQITRVLFCEWHESVEKVNCWNILFPILSFRPENIPRLKMDRVVAIKKQVVDHGLFYNPGQVALVKAILAQPAVSGPLPPIIVQGAFGTGKTYTLAQAIKQLLAGGQARNKTRIILCTISNSAADLYITEYLHPFMKQLQQEALAEGKEEVVLPCILRYYKTQRDPSCINIDVLRYCRLSKKPMMPGRREFASLKANDVMQAQLIISNLAGVLDLCKLDLPPDMFSHVILDEAAQSFETDTLKALCLVGPTTRVVMAGDPRQMIAGTVNCSLLKRYGFDRALIDRLAKDYGQEQPEFANLGYGHVLQTNYRCHPQIMEFIRANFYPDLENMKNEYHCSFTAYYPFRFYNTDTINGSEKFHQPSSSFFNYSEVCEVQYRIIELLHHWPPEFNEYDEHDLVKVPQSQIVVLCPDDAQVMLMQSKLSERTETAQVKVANVQWIQGMEFRAVFISTVRTLKPANESEVANYDLAFLSDMRLLNTAITRAKSLVIIVGSYLTLTSVGKCKTAWKSLADGCSQANTLFNASNSKIHGMPTEENKVVASSMGKELLQSRFEKVTLVPDYREQRLMRSDAQQALSSFTNDLRQPTRRKAVVFDDNETNEIRYRHPSFVQVVEHYLKFNPGVFAKNWPVPSRMVLLNVIGTTEYYSNVRHFSNLINRDEANVVVDLIKRLLKIGMTNDIVVVCGTAAQAAHVNKFLVTLPRERLTVIDITHPLPRLPNIGCVVLSMVRTGVKSDRALQQEKHSSDRLGRAKSCLGADLVNMEVVPRVLDLSAQSGSVVFVGNSLNASVFPAYDWLFRKLTESGVAFDSLRDMAIAGRQ